MAVAATKAKAAKAAAAAAAAQSARLHEVEAAARAALQAGRAREALLREATERERAARARIAELEAELEAAAASAGSVQDDAGSELEELRSQVGRLERKLKEAASAFTSKDSKIATLTARLNTLAASSTEMHPNDLGYWVERKRRLDFSGVGGAKGRAGGAPREAKFAEPPLPPIADGAGTRRDEARAAGRSKAKARSQPLTANVK